MRAEEVAELIRQLREPDITQSHSDALREQIVLGHQGLVHHFIKVRDPYEIEDLVQVGNIGLIRAIDQFDPQRGNSFATFAATQIRGEISHYLRDQHHAIRIPRSIYESTQKVNSAIEHLVSTLERMPSVREVSEYTNLDPELVLEILESMNVREVKSLSEPESWDLAPSDENGFESVEVKATLAPALDLLSEQDRQLVYMRFYQGLKQSQIATETGLSQVTVSRRINQILSDLRRDTGEL